MLPGTGGLTRVTDKRKVRRDLADVFCAIEEGVRGSKAVEWRLVDEVVPNSKWKDAVAARARDLAARSDRPQDATGIALTPIERRIEEDRVAYTHVDVEIDRAARLATVTVRGPAEPVPASIEAAARRKGAAILAARASRASWRTRSCICASTSRRSGSLVFRTEGDPEAVLAHDALPRAADATG